MTFAFPFRSTAAAVLGACVAASPLVAHAATTAPPVIEAYAALDNLSLTLIDLKPSIFTRPSVTFRSEEYVYSGGGANTKLYTNALLPKTSTSITQGEHGAVSTTPSSIHAQFDYSAQQLLAEASKDLSHPDVAIFAMPNVNTNVYAQKSSLFQRPGPATFTLSAHTTLVLKGEATLKYTFDGSSIPGALAGTIYDQYDIGPNTAGAGVSIWFMPTGQNYDTVSPNASFSLGLGAPAAGIETGGPSLQTAQKHQSFEIRLTNDSNKAMTGTFNLDLLADGSNYVLFRNSSVLPEPGTYALMGLGLVGIASASRRRRARG